MTLAQVKCRIDWNNEHFECQSEAYKLGYAYYVFEYENNGETIGCPYPDNSKEAIEYGKGWDTAQFDYDE